MGADKRQASSPANTIIMCRFLWPSKDDDFRVVWQKVLPLPFMPRDGDRLVVDGCWSLDVAMATYSVDDGMAEVCIRAWSRHRDSWEDEKRQFEEWGWELWNIDDDLPPCFDAEEPVRPLEAAYSKQAGMDPENRTYHEGRMSDAEKLRRAMLEDWEFVGDPWELCHIFRRELQRVQRERIPK